MKKTRIPDFFKSKSRFKAAFILVHVFLQFFTLSEIWTIFNENTPFHQNKFERLIR